MHAFLKSIIFVTTVVTLALSSVSVMAQVQPISSSDCSFLGLVCTGNETVVDLEFRLFLIVNSFLVMVDTIAFIFLIYAALKYITSQGDVETAATAKRQVVYAVIGLILAGLATTIVNAVITVDFSMLEFSLNLIVNAFLAMVGTIAVIFLIYAGLKYITSQGDVEAADTAKRQIVYAVGGLVLIGLAWFIVNAVLSLDTTFLQAEITTYVNAFFTIVGLIAAIFLIYAGLKYITSGGDEEAAATAKRQILYAIIGLLVIGLANVITNAILTLDTTQLRQDVTTVINALLTLAALAAAIFIIYGGARYITSQGDPDQARTARQAIIYSVLGLLVIGVAAVFVNFIIRALLSA